MYDGNDVTHITCSIARMNNGEMPTQPLAYYENLRYASQRLHAEAATAAVKGSDARR